MSTDHLFIEVIKKRFVTYKELGEKAIMQLNDTDIHKRQHESENSVYIIVKHLHGNMLSRFTDFLSSDGEKPWRKRDAEFVKDENADLDQLLKLWEKGWNCLLQTLTTLNDTDLQNQVSIRGEAHLVLDALLRQVAHYAYHVGQIVYIAKNLKGDAWKPLSIPPGASEEFNRQMKAKHGST